MKRLPPSLVILPGLAAFAVFLWLYPAANHAGPIKLDRAVAHSQAVTATRNLLNLDVSAWPWTSKVEVRRNLLLWRNENARQSSDRFATPLEAELTFKDPGSRREITVTLSSEGSLTGIKQNLGRNRTRDKEPADGSALLNEPMARKIFESLAGDLSPLFQPQKASRDYRWRAPAAPNTLAWEVAVKGDESGFREAFIRPEFNDALQRQYALASRGLTEIAEAVPPILFGVGGAVTVILFSFAWMRGMVDLRSSLTMGALFLVIQYQTATFGNSLLTGALITAATALGQSMARDMEWPHWLAFRLFLQRRWTARAVGSSVACGLLWSGLLALIPIAILASGQFPHANFNPAQELNALLAPRPALAVIAPPFTRLSFALFAVLLPFLSQRIGVSWISTVIFLPLAMLANAGFSHAATGIEAVVCESLLLSAVSLFLYSRYGLLAVLCAAKGSAALLQAALFLNGSSHLRESAFHIFAGFASIWAVALVIAARGRNVEPTDAVAFRYLSQREKLKVEFSLAQQAQQRMLPAHPPLLEGFSIAAVCQPAREVGGDLYDYFRLPSGGAGFCVADVSGKGMPAALYMTLTKGLIAAASPDSSDILQLARSLNRHLHIACKRKMFVTAILASVDVPTRRVDMIRAGHNPALLYESSTRAARYLNPPGIGLGLAGPPVFDRGAKLDQITLAAGDILVFYSDGVTEAMNEKLELFGEQRLKESLERAAGGPASVILDEIRKDLSGFTGSEPAHDDVTLLILRAQSPGDSLR